MAIMHFIKHFVIIIATIRTTHNWAVSCFVTLPLLSLLVWVNKKYGLCIEENKSMRLWIGYFNTKAHSVFHRLLHSWTVERHTVDILN